VFAHEAGGHRWQGESNGQVHTSTVTVATLPDPPVAMVIPDRDIVWTAQIGHGPGGQHRNKTASAIMATHTPTGLTAYCQSERSQHRNRASALAVLRARVWERQQAAQSAGRGDVRRAQIGSGQRGDKVRTYRLKDNVATDHRTGKKLRLDTVLAGAEFA
jgi:peptide chain release factor 1